MRVRNAGNAAASDVIVTDTPAAASPVLGARPSVGSCSGTAPVRCSLGDLAAGATAEVELRTRATRKGCRRQRGAGRLADAIRGRSRARGARHRTRAAAHDVRLSKTSARARAGAGDRVTFTLTARSRAHVTGFRRAGVRPAARRPRLRRRAGRPATAAAGRAGPCACAPGRRRRLTLTARAAELARTRRIRNTAVLRGPTVATRSARAAVTVRGLAGPTARSAARGRWRGAPLSARTFRPRGRARTATVAPGSGPRGPGPDARCVRAA